MLRNTRILVGLGAVAALALCAREGLGSVHLAYPDPRFPAVEVEEENGAAGFLANFRITGYETIALAPGDHLAFAITTDSRIFSIDGIFVMYAGTNTLVAGIPGFEPNALTASSFAAMPQPAGLGAGHTWSGFVSESPVTEDVPAGIPVEILVQHTRTLGVSLESARQMVDASAIGTDRANPDGSLLGSDLTLVLVGATSRQGMTFSVKPYCVAKVNSLGCTPAIYGVGAPRASGGSGSFWIGAYDVLNNKAGIMFYGANPSSAPFQGGTLCVMQDSTFTRTPQLQSGGNPPPNDCSGRYLYDMGGRIASGLDPFLAAGANVRAQFWYRDGVSPSGTGLTNGLQFRIDP